MFQQGQAPVPKRPRGAPSSEVRHIYAKKLESVEEKTLYASVINVYDFAPNVDISINEFEKYALARLKALRIIERANSSAHRKLSPEWTSAIRADFRKQELHEFQTICTNTNEVDADTLFGCRKFDHISHFLLRLAFAKTEEQRRWFVGLEADFLRLKLKLISATEFKEFLEATGFSGKMVTEKERKNYMTEMSATLGGQSNKNLLQRDIYKIPFENALEEVRSRKVFLRDGYAFILYNDMANLVGSVFRANLSESLAMILKNMSVVDNDPRITQVLADFDKRYTGNDYTNKKSSDSAVTAEQLPALSLSSFPLCMKSLYDVVVKDHHLKHFGRLQLGLFFKGVGLDLEEATSFWRSHFTKKPEIDGSRFDKQYLYNIRHMYGKEGKRADYTPYSCLKIINSNVGPGDHHGCPFKHSDASHLKSTLTEAKVSANEIKEILGLVEGHHYQLACQKYFEATHSGANIEGGLSHPNQYFEEARDSMSLNKKKKAEEKVKTTNVKVYAKQEIKQENESMDIEDEIKEFTEEEKKALDEMEGVVLD